MTQDISALESQYNEITELYELAEELVNTVEQSDNPEQQLRTVEPLIDQIGESADILCEEFIKVAGEQQKATSSKNRVEGALRKMYMAMDRCKRRAKRNSKNIGEQLLQVTESIVDKVKLQVEKVISNFVDFIHLSLDRIMQKQHIDDLKERQEKIANMLYAAQHQQTLAH